MRSGLRIIYFLFDQSSMGCFCQSTADEPNLRDILKPSRVLMRPARDR